MNLTINDLAFPVFVLKGNVVGLHKNAESLTSCSPQALASKHFDDLQLIAMDGRTFVVKSAKNIGTRKRWWSPPLFLRLIKVELELLESGNIGLEVLKQRLFTAFKADPHSWECMGLTYDEFAAEVKKCSSFREIADYIGKF